MEKWKEVFCGIIPSGNYETCLVNGEENGLTIKLSNSQNIVKIKFGIVQAVRMLDEGIVQTGLYSGDEINKYKKSRFENVIYEIEEGEFKNQFQKMANSYGDIFDFRHYLVVTMNYNIDIIAEHEPAIEINKVGLR